MRAKSLYIFKATAADEADLEKGKVLFRIFQHSYEFINLFILDEEVIIVKKSTADWWIIEKENGRRGLVPSSYLNQIQVLHTPSATTVESQSFDNDDDTSEPEIVINHILFFHFI